MIKINRSHLKLAVTILLIFSLPITFFVAAYLPYLKIAEIPREPKLNKLPSQVHVESTALVAVLDKNTCSITRDEDILIALLKKDCMGGGDIQRALLSLAWLPPDRRRLALIGFETEIKGSLYTILKWKFPVEYQELIDYYASPRSIFRLNDIPADDPEHLIELFVSRFNLESALRLMDYNAVVSAAEAFLMDGLKYYLGPGEITAFKFELISNDQMSFNAVMGIRGMAKRQPMEVLEKLQDMPLLAEFALDALSGPQLRDIALLIEAEPHLFDSLHLEGGRTFNEVVIYMLAMRNPRAALEVLSKAGNRRISPELATYAASLYVGAHPDAAIDWAVSSGWLEKSLDEWAASGLTRAPIFRSLSDAVDWFVVYYNSLRDANIDLSIKIELLARVSPFPDQFWSEFDGSDGAQRLFVNETQRRDIKTMGGAQFFGNRDNLAGVLSNAGNEK